MLAIEVTCYAILGGGVTLASGILATIAIPFRAKGA